MSKITSFVLLFCLTILASADTARAQGANLLAGEGSPYLRQHADDLVNWMPWGDAAFERGKREDKPVFLSIGYSTCYWCHVMRRESFKDQATAELINQLFVPVLVDRERRPDVDETYGLATQLIAGVGGWPTNVFLTADRKPFYAVIYVPRDVLQQTLVAVDAEWTANRAELNAGADKLAGVIHQYLNRREAAVELTPELLAKASAHVVSKFDPDYGGVAGGAKFMRPSLLLFLLRQAAAHRTDAALKTVEATLHGILNGGVHDQVGGGVHRYAEDREWRVPHFEKMLYDQALIAQTMLRAFSLSGKQRYEVGARGTLDFVLEHLSDASGGFYAALDAGEEGEEGEFYLWTREELTQALGTQDAAFAEKVFGVSAQGNFNGRNVLYLKNTPDNLAAFYKLDQAMLEARIAAILSKLKSARGARAMPATDRKIITSWNAAMTVAYAEAADQLSDDVYRQAALANGTFIWSQLRSEAGGFRRSLFLGEPTGEGTLLDNAYAALAFIALYDLTGEAVWLTRATETADFIVEKFRDTEAGDFYMTLDDIAFGRTKLRNDGDMPSGSAIMLDVLARLSKRTLEPEYRLHAEALLAAISGMALKDPAAHAYTLLAGDQLLRGELTERQYIANGRVRARARIDKGAGLLRVSLAIKPGWHINSNRPLEEDFIATDLKVSGVTAEVTYPMPFERKFSFNDKPLSVYEGRIELTVPFDENAKPPASVELTVQACNDRMCLLPETAALRLNAVLAAR